jgi:serine/threonine protein kinase
MATGSTSSNVVGVHYRVGKKIGEGSFGVIFEGTNLLNQQQVAIKFEPRKSDAPQLRDEYRTYKILVGCRESLPSPFIDTCRGTSAWPEIRCLKSESQCYSCIQSHQVLGRVVLLLMTGRTSQH